MAQRLSNATSNIPILNKALQDLATAQVQIAALQLVVDQLRNRHDFTSNLQTANISLSSGWGTTATVSAHSGTQHAGLITISSSGTGQAANPTVTIALRQGTSFTARIPKPIATPADTHGVLWAVTKTVQGYVTFTFVGTPSAGQTYSFTYSIPSVTTT